MKYIINKYHFNVPDKVLLADLRKIAKRMGKKHVGYNEYEAEGEYTPGTMSKRFGGWNAALIKAGLKIKKLRRISNSDLMANLGRVWDSLGRQPFFEDMKSPVSLYYPTCYSTRYGSWRKSLFAFVKFVKQGKYKPVNDAAYKKFRSTKIRNKKRPVKRNKTHVNKSMRFDVLKRDNYKCRLCGASPAKDPNVTLHVDHIIPASKGGENILKNLQTLCSDCNLGKAAKTINN